MSDFSFRTTHAQGSARLGWFTTPHGVVETPAFMPVATQGTIKGLAVEEVAAAGGRLLLSNAYHLSLRPGDMMVRALGGLHAFTRWDGPMLTDSGGFQLFSLAKLRTVREEGVEFRSHIDGSLREYTPESVMRIERNIGADVIMQLDELIAGGAELTASRAAMERSLRWLVRCSAEFDRIAREGREPAPPLAVPAGAPPLATDDPAADLVPPPQALFPIVQGGTHPELRRASAAGILDRGAWHGVAIGGLSVGEAKPDMYAMIEVCDPVLPRTVPRYLMGVGFPDDLVEAVRRGIDLFDCVAPTRMGRDGTAFTPDGKVQIRRSSYRTDRRPLVAGCGCPGCARYDRAYLRHLFVSGEMLGLRLLALHNVTFLLDVMRDARAALAAGAFEGWSAAWLARYRSGDADGSERAARGRGDGGTDVDDHRGPPLDRSPAMTIDRSDRPDQPDQPAAPHPSSPERNPLGLGPRDREGSNTGSVADTSYNAHGSDPYTTGEPRKDFGPSGADAGPSGEDGREPAGER